MEKGSWLLRGKFGLNVDRNKTDIKSSLPNYPSQPDIIESVPSIMFSPGIGYFIAENLVLGLEGTYGRSRGKYSNSFSKTSRLITNNFGIGLFVRKYVPLNDKISFYMEVNGGKNWEKPFGKNEAGEKFSPGKFRSMRVNGILGFQYLITKKLRFDFYSNLIQYSSDKNMDLFGNKIVSEGHQLSLNLNSSFRIGLNVFFKAKNPSDPHSD
jgi:hypothetical protein